MGRLNLRWDLESKTNFEESLGGVSWLKTSPSSIGRSCSVQKKELSWAEQVRKNRTREISASRFIIFVHLQPRALHHWWQWSRISWEQPSCLCHLCPEMRGIPWNFGQEGNDFHQLWIQGTRRRICVLMGQPGSLISFTSVVPNNIPLFSGSVIDLAQHWVQNTEENTLFQVLIGIIQPLSRATSPRELPLLWCLSHLAPRGVISNN